MLDFNKFIPTDEDISPIENQFGFKFNDGQKKVIRYWHSADIQACPGSGKTTTLAAKLILLANKVQKSLHKGVCIITHTNVAVDEIRRRLGPHSNFYFNYPNHFGTIQSVVDKYFTIPYYKQKYKQPPIIIDTDSYCAEINKFHSLKATSILLNANNIDEAGYLSFNRHNFNVSKSINETEPFAIERIAKDKMQAHYEKIKNAKDTLLSYGFIKYDEAYSIAFKYLRENPQIKELFSRRFSLIFIDEMQDMETHQSELLSLLLDGTSAIVQKIGDRNQSIYNRPTSEEQRPWKPNVNPELQLCESTRIPQNIAAQIKDVCIEPQEMSGRPKATPLKPTILVHEDSSILKVKDKFGELIVLYNLQDGICKAVGARLSDSKLNINSYWTEFNRGQSKTEFTNLASFLEKAKQQSIRNKNVVELRKTILNIFCKCLRLCKVKNPTSNRYFTPFTLPKHLSLHYDQEVARGLNLSISQWILSISDTEELKSKVETRVSELIVLLGGTVNIELKQFFAKPEVESENDKMENRIYTCLANGKEVEIHFDTIHGVKGESHNATLYLETYTQKVFDIGGKILEFIKSPEKNRSKQRADSAFRKRLPLAYVAMTRATDFICLTVHKDRFSESQKKYFENNNEWQVIYL